MEQQKTSAEVMETIEAIGMMVQAIVLSEGIGAYVEGFGIMVNSEAMGALVMDELAAAAGDELTSEVETFLANL